MLRKEIDLLGYRLHATDGELGMLQEHVFDKDAWTVRYLLVKTGPWLDNRDVFISPIALGSIDEERKCIQVKLKQGQVAGSPHVNIHKPVSRRYEVAYYNYYGWPVYWGAGGRWGNELYAKELFDVAPFVEAPGSHEEQERTTNLMNTGGIKGYRVFARDNRIGTVEDFIMNDESWAIRYLVVNGTGLKAPRQVVLSPLWFSDLSQAERMMTLDFSIKDIESSPQYDPTRVMHRGDELALFQHYGRGKEIDAIFVGMREPAL